ncbi:class I tRNA ligase family protein [Candidatus Parcubacteria bacterium]|uniref:Isoleucine--tRNA ligase n=1 Tax=Candidatus Kaiserbacteria bacterium CG10_big_fil_rev_8_21_14_0_10_47_16 TaxID=1974608 RepID=A0A2H0UGN8_9BACT|nr:class I tRNA ligase family protein [Candidatus Parcubacteria bacterium]PIR84846.1 MAG: hypothetical protein COU16_00460 [Candidatus Kaiserbacteria bacterium CG10_big_fil_rev_8_21_14_0_10_47_16]
MNKEKNNTADAVEKSDVALREEETLAFWKAEEIFNKSVEKDAPHGDFVFYDGPPFATGLPHYGHILAGTIKDAIPRFWTMNGYRVKRRWGWDCHGLPLENLIEKRLGLATKRDIEELGVQTFNETAREAVLEYADDWKRIIPRMGRFVDMDNDYKTMDPTYTESVWHVFSELNKKGLVYEGFKSMHLCPRCGTTLSNFEVNQGYKDIKDIAVTVKLPLVDEPDTSLLVWTTTPWTLPGNMAAAVNKDIEYVKVRVKTEEGEETVILAKERLSQLGTDEYEVLETVKGKDLVGKSYVPPFNYLQKQDIENKENAWKIYHADYVEIGEEGTGAVHIAPAYGEDDMNLAKENGVPIVHHVNTAGHFMDFVTDFAGLLVKPKDDEASEVTHLDSDIEVVRNLKARNLLLQKENITHSYPHCWRCDTPLLNYATTSWFVKVTDIKDKLVAENKKVKWVPEHVGTSRFGKWLEGARDWAISRQRYWGAPLPIWKNSVTKEYKIFGSLAEMQEYVPKSGNQYFLMRHGESESNVQGIISAQKENNDPLTEKGIDQVQKAAKDLPKGIEYIFHSGFLRTKQTAEAIAEILGVPSENLIEDPRIGELDAGDALEGKTWADHKALYADRKEEFTKDIEGVESRQSVQKRSGEFLYEVDAKYQDKKILIVGHGSSLYALKAVTEGGGIAASITLREEGYLRDFKNAEIRELPFTPMPHNDNFELDYHRPYIDNIDLYEGEVKLERVPDVFDCWFESGSMPYGQNHYPFENLDTFNPKKGKGYPAQFIAEGLDQTRGWFYSLLVLGTALFGKSPYENVIVNGLVLAEDGKKMSKKLQNYPDPAQLADRVGADAIRFYLLASPTMKGEDLNFSEKDVLELHRKNIGRLHNVLAMYEMYADGTKADDDSKNVLDRWIIARLNDLTACVTDGFKNYELDKATRPITDFIDDLSVWYMRRSRDRFKQNLPFGSSALLRDPAVSDTVQNRTALSSAFPRLASETETSDSEDLVKDKALALATLRHVLKTLSLVMAPSMPFYAEYLYGQVKEGKDPESVHLANWPKVKKVDAGVMEEMQIVRDVVTLGLEARSRANIKVRQPLQALKVTHVVHKLRDEYLALIRDEVNVKEIVHEGSLGEGEVALDTTITPELQMEGDAREFIRAIQEMRKQAGLEPSDRITLMVQTSDSGEAVIRTFEKEVTATVGADSISFGNAEGNEITAGEHSLTVELTKRN